MFLKDNKNILSSLNIENCKNKRGYLFYKKCLSHILINTFSNAATGWLLFAGFFYSIDQYVEMSRVLQLASR